MPRRIDKLADLGCSMVTLSGGEPTLHPNVDSMISEEQSLRTRLAVAEQVELAAIWRLWLR